VHALQVRLARQGDQRGAIQERVCYGCDKVCRSRAKGPQANTGSAREAAIGIRHIGTALLVSDRNELNRRIGDGLAQIERLLARNTEDVPNALRLQALHENF